MFNVVIAIEIKVHATTPLQEGKDVEAPVCRMYAKEPEGVSYRDARCRVHRTHVAPAILIAPIKRWPLYQCRRRGLSPPIPRPGVDQTDRYELFPRN